MPSSAPVHKPSGPGAELRLLSEPRLPDLHTLETRSSSHSPEHVLRENIGLILRCNFIFGKITLGP